MEVKWWYNNKRNKTILKSLSFWIRVSQPLHHWHCFGLDDSLVWWNALCTTGHLAASLASTLSILVMSLLLWQPKLSPDIAKCPPWSQNCLSWDHCSSELIYQKTKPNKNQFPVHYTLSFHCPKNLKTLLRQISVISISYYKEKERKACALQICFATLKKKKKKTPPGRVPEQRWAPAPRDSEGPARWMGCSYTTYHHPRAECHR